LKADKANGSIILDDITELIGIPKEAWNYKLGNRSAIEWLLDQYKEKASGDATITEKFNNYQFADHKQDAIALIKKICLISNETINICKLMEAKTE
jgi:predicted helicase